MIRIIIIFITIIIFGLITYFIFRNRKIKEPYKNFIEPALGHSTSCIDCEKQFVAEEKWRGQSSKCFSCETDMLKRYGEEAVFMATKQKCFDC